MPSTAKIEKQGSTESSQSGTEPLKQVQLLVEKKIRNLEKRKTRLEHLQEEVKSGKGLNEDQKKALGKYDDVLEILEFFRDFSKSVSTIFTDTQKAAKKAAKQEQSERTQRERERLQTIIKYQDLLSSFGEAKVRKDFTNGTNGAIKLPSNRLDQLDELRKGIRLSRNRTTEQTTSQVASAADRLYALSEGKNREAVPDATFKELKESIEQIELTGYFNKVASLPEPQQTSAPKAAPTQQATVQAPQPMLVQTQLINDQAMLNQYNQNTPSQYPDVNFIQESSLVDHGIAGDPAIITLVPQGGYPHGQYVDLDGNGQPQNFENGSPLIPSQTITNSSYANSKYGNKGQGNGYGNQPFRGNRGRGPRTDQRGERSDRQRRDNNGRDGQRRPQHQAAHASKEAKPVNT
jgi:hypothetical protein